VAHDLELIFDLKKNKTKNQRLRGVEGKIGGEPSLENTDGAKSRCEVVLGKGAQSLRSPAPIILDENTRRGRRFAFVTVGEWDNDASPTSQLRRSHLI